MVPHCAQKQDHSLLVLLVIAAANLQSAPSPPACISPHYSHDRGRHMLSCAWLWPLLVQLDPGNQCRRPHGLACSLEICVVLFLCRQAFLYFRGVAFDVICSMQSLPCFDTDCFASRTAVADFPEALHNFALVASCAVQQSENSLMAAARSSHEQSRSSCSRPWSFWTRSSSPAVSAAAACIASPASCSHVTFATVASKVT